MSLCNGWRGPRKSWFMVKTKGPWITRSGKPRNLEVLCEIFNMEKVASYCFKIIKKDMPSKYPCIRFGPRTTTQLVNSVFTLDKEIHLYQTENKRGEA